MPFFSCCDFKILNHWEKKQFLVQKLYCYQKITPADEWNISNAKLDTDQDLFLLFISEVPCIGAVLIVTTNNQLKQWVYGKGIACTPSLFTHISRVRVENSSRPRPHCAGKFKNAALFYGSRPTVHTYPSRKRSFSKTLLKPEEFENAGFSFSCGQQTFGKGSFSKTMTSR